MIQCQKMRPSLKKTGGRFAFCKESSFPRELPEAVMYIPEATYLAWVDMSKCLPNGSDLPDFFANKSRCAAGGWERPVRGQCRWIYPAELGDAPQHY